MSGLINSGRSGIVASLDNVSLGEKVTGVSPTVSGHPGMISPFAMTTAPTGWLICDGSAISRSTYSDLFSAISTAWGSGNGSSTFNIPDLRGWFLRGHDGGAGTDPNASSRTGGDVIGSTQQYMVHNHVHWMESWYGEYGIGSNNPHNQGYGSAGPYGDSIYSRNISDDTTAANKTYTGGVETRPKNKAVQFNIKF